MRRSLLSLVAAVAAVIVLAGCTAFPLPGLLPTSAPAKPAVGDCWTTTTANAGAWADWRGGGAQSCASTHALYTYAVGEIRGVSAKSWAVRGEGSTLIPSVEAKAGDACNPSKLLPHLGWNQQLIQSYFFVPTEAQWKSGARWVRCDVGLLAFGTTFGAERFAPLPAKISTLVADTQSDPKRYELCVSSALPATESGPLDDPNSKLADCRDSPQWALTGHGPLPDAAGAPFPSSAAASTESDTVCAKFAADPGEVWVAYLPSPADWKSGAREVDCWVGQTEVASGQSV
ncbi:MAG: septum formation family protein [Galbitalea sp.]